MRAENFVQCRQTCPWKTCKHRYVCDSSVFDPWETPLCVHNLELSDEVSNKLISNHESPDERTFGSLRSLNAEQESIQAIVPELKGFLIFIFLTEENFKAESHT